MPRQMRPVLVVLALLSAGAAAVLILHQVGFIDYITDQEAVRSSVQSLGQFGPVLLIGLMIVAIVASPVPSAPIALAAGAAYGPLQGAIYTIIGAVGGAIVAFSISRFFAYDAVRQWGGVKKLLDRLERGRSQTWLMGAVFLSRLVPFVSFDAISYAAGLTPLTFWRFALATTAAWCPSAFCWRMVATPCLPMGAKTSASGSWLPGVLR